MTNRAWTLSEQLALVKRGYELRKACRIGIILADCGRLYIAESEHDPWGSKRRLTWDEFAALIIEAELPRKPVALADLPEPSRLRSVRQSA